MIKTNLEVVQAIHRAPGSRTWDNFWQCADKVILSQLSGGCTTTTVENNSPSHGPQRRIPSRLNLGDSVAHSLGFLVSQKAMSEIGAPAPQAVPQAAEPPLNGRAEVLAEHHPIKPTYLKMKIKYLKLHKSKGFPVLLSAN